MEGSAWHPERAKRSARSRSLDFTLSRRNQFIIKQVVEILKNRFLLACVHDEAAFAASKLARESLTYSIDRELVRRELIELFLNSLSFFVLVQL